MLWTPVFQVNTSAFERINHVMTKPQHYGSLLDNYLNRMHRYINSLDYEIYFNESIVEPCETFYDIMVCPTSSSSSYGASMRLN